MAEQKRYVYPFDEAYGLGKEILGGKGAGLAEMTHIGVPVPEGFTITTEACTYAVVSCCVYACKSLVVTQIQVGLKPVLSPWFFVIFPVIV